MDSTQQGPPGIPQWVKVSALVAGILLLGLIAIMVISGGEHGPGRHQMGDKQMQLGLYAA